MSHPRIDVLVFEGRPYGIHAERLLGPERVGSKS